MKTYEIIGTKGITANPRDKTEYKNIVEFDDCFSIFDVYTMLRAYFGQNGCITEFAVKEIV